MTYDVFRHFLSDMVSHRSAMRHVPLERCCMSLEIQSILDNETAASNGSCL